MGVVLREPTDAEEPVHGARALVPAKKCVGGLANGCVLDMEYL